MKHLITTIKTISWAVYNGNELMGSMSIIGSWWSKGVRIGNSFKHTKWSHTKESRSNNKKKYHYDI